MAADTKTLRVIVTGDSTKAQRSLTDVGKTAQETEKKTSGLHKSFGGLKTVMGAGLALGGMAGLGAFFKSSIDGAAEAARGTRILHSQISNLGPAGKTAFKDAEQFASDFGATIGVDDDDIKAVQSKLASFPDAFKKGSMGADGMKRSVKAAFDLQAIGIGDAQSNIVGLGKAMNDPVKGMNALAKSGVSFSTIQKEQIKQAMKQGDLAGAQKILMEGIESNAKGAAEAGVSPLQKMKTAIQDTGEKVGTLLLPALNKIATIVVTKIIPKANELIDKFGPKITAGLSAVGTVITTKVMPKVQGLIDKFGPKITDALSSAKDMIGKLFSGGGKGSGELTKTFASIKESVEKLWPFIKGLKDDMPKLTNVFDLGAKVLKFFADHANLLIDLLPAIAVGFVAVKVAQIAGNIAAAAAVPVKALEIITNRGLAASNRELALAVRSGVVAQEEDVAVQNVSILTRARAAVAMMAQKVATVAVSVATKVWSATTWALGVAMRFATGPIGMIVIGIAALVAGVIYAYTHFKWFRDIVQTVWSAIKTASLAVVKFFMTYVWPMLKVIIGFIIGYVKFLWSVFVAVFHAIQTAVAAVVKFFMTYVWPVLKTAFGFIVGIVKGLWNTFSAIFGYIKDKVMAVVGWITNTAWPMLKAGFDVIKTAVKVVWDTWKSIFDFIKSKVETVMTAAVTAFGNAKDAIGTAWGKLQELAKKPVNFIIETVYNNGILKFWNFIADKVGLKPLSPLAKLAGGGPIDSDIVGDNVPLLGQAGEYMLNRKQVAKAGGWRGIEALFGEAGREGASGGRYAGGGIIGGIAGAGNWLADKGTNLVKGSILKVAEPLIRTIKATIALLPGTGDLPDALRRLPTNALDSFLKWLKPKDVAPTDGAIGGPIGAIGVIPAWVTAARDHSSFGKNSGVGMWLYQVVKAAGLASSNQGIFQVRNTATGNHSMHGYGRAVDLPASMAIFNFLRANYGSHMKELIHSPANNLQIYNGRNHMYTGITRAMHFNHVHASYDDGGILPPGTTIATNNTGRNEYVMTGDQLRPNVTVNVTVQGNVTAEKALAENIATAVRDALLRKASRNGGRTGLV